MSNAVQKHNIFHFFAVVLVRSIKGIIFLAVWLTLAYVGFLIFSSKKSPADLIVGLPLLLVGGGLASHSLWDIILVFSPTYNRGMCFLCKR